MDKTPFADLTRLLPGDPLSLDGASFLWRNPAIIDRLLQVGAQTHKHDAHPPLPDPQGEPTVVADPTQGNIPADTTVSVCYTLIDEDGGETAPSPVASVGTPAAMEPPALTPDVNVVYDAGGGITIGSYFYAVTLIDDSGGETTIGTSVQADREAGGATAKIVISGLAAIVAGTPGATGWRLYRATGGGQFRFLEDGAADELVDDGTLCADCDTLPPATNTTNQTNAIRVTIPTTLDVLASEAIRIYMTTTGDFVSPAFAEQILVAEAGVELVYASIILEEGSPPDISTSLGGAGPIDAATDIANLFWRAPVADLAALNALDPALNAIGDVRLTLNDLLLHAWDGDTWELATAATSWQAPVADVAALPAADNTAGDVRVALDGQTIHVWDGAAWVEPYGLHNAGLTVDPAWTAADAAEADMPKPYGLGWLIGKVQKVAGAAPVNGEVLGVIDAVLAPVRSQVVGVVTGDVDGLEHGFVEIVGGFTDPPNEGKILWRGGRSTDPATKAPFVSFHGVTYVI